MQEKYNEATHNRPHGDRQLDAPMVKIDLHAYTQQIKDENAWHKNDRNAITVFKSDNMHIVLVAMHKGAELLPQVADSVLCVQVLEGHINFIVDDTRNEIREGHIISLHENIGYNIVAIEESTFLLTMSGIIKKSQHSIH